MRVGEDRDGILQAALDRCAESNTICSERYSAAQSDSRVYVLNIGDLACPQSSCPAGRTQLNARDASKDPLGNDFTFGPVTITIDPANFGTQSRLASKRAGRDISLTIDDVLGHELGGHAAGTLLMYLGGAMKVTKDGLGWCDEPCARKFDDLYREQRSLPTIWGP